MARPSGPRRRRADGRLPLAPGRRPCAAEHQRGARRRRRRRSPTSLAVAMRGLAWNRYPDRSAAALRSRIAEVEGERVPGGLAMPNVFVANGSNEVLQTLCLAYGGAGRTRADPRADLCAALPHRPGVWHRRGRRAAQRRLHPGRRRGRVPRSTRHARRSRSCARRTTRPVGSRIAARCAEVLGRGRVGRRPAGGRRGLRAVLAVVGAVAGRRGPLGRGHPHLLQDLVGRGAAAGLPGRADLVRRRAGEGRAAVPPRRAQAARRPAGARPPRRDAGTGRPPGGAAGPGRDALDALEVDQWPSAANFILFRPVDRSGRARSGPTWSSDRCWSATARRGRG